MSAIPIESAPSRVVPQPRLLLTIEEAAEVLATSRSSFYREVLPHVETVRLGARRLVVAAALEAFVTAMPRVGVQ